MRCLMFWFVPAFLFAAPAPAQQVPGRDLLDFPAGVAAEMPALAAQIGSGLWNPAMMALPAAVRAQLGVAALNTPADQGLGIYVASASVALPARTTVGFSVVRASLAGLLRTDTDPQTLGGEIPYNTTLLSVGAARRGEWVVTGLAIRYRTGQADARRSAGVGIDGGVLAERPFGTETRLAASTFLWRPASAPHERPVFQVAGDARIFGRDSLRQTRVGYSLSATRHTGEQYFFGSSRWDRWTVRGGVAQQRAFASSSWAPRLGVGLQYARYTIAVARDEDPAGVSTTYQFTLSTRIQ